MNAFKPLKTNRYLRYVQVVLRTELHVVRLERPIGDRCIGELQHYCKINMEHINYLWGKMLKFL
jgi:hypothetical protein